MEKSFTWAMTFCVFSLTINGRTAESAPLQYSQISPDESSTITDILLRSVQDNVILALFIVINFIIYL